MTRGHRLAAGVIAAIFLALHLPFPPASLEDLDSINFALGVRQFDVGNHQPHPPGYPVFILAGKAAHRIFASEAVALSSLGIAGGALSALALIVLFRKIDQPSRDDDVAVPATLLTLGAPLYWFTASRPLSDMMGLAAALGIQAATLSSASIGGLTFVAGLAGLGVGIRSQVAWLTVPLIALQVWRLPGPVRTGAALRTAAAFGAGVLVWAIPLVWLSGGPAAYWNVLFRQGAEDLSGVVMVYTTPTVRELARAVYAAFVAPWVYVAEAAVVLAFAALGFARLGLRSRSALLTLAAAFGPYLVFDLLFQETITTRYALPILVPIAYLAASGLFVFPRRLALAATIAISAVGVVVAEQALLGYARAEAPAFRMLADMRRAQGAAAPVLSMHRKEDFDLRRAVQWSGVGVEAFAARLPSTPKHEWLEVVKYWNNGGTAPIWFIADPLRSDLALFDHQGPAASYRWPFDHPELIGGIRPNEMDWYVLERPAWYLGEGWSITPETAGVAKEDTRSLARSPATGWTRREPGPVTLMLGGRNLSQAAQANVRLAVDGHLIDNIPVPPGFFLRMLTLPAGALAGTGEYAAIAVSAEAETSDPARRGDGTAPDVAIEQFDVQPAGQIVVGFDQGWHEQEYNPTTGKLWRWTSDRATVRIRSAGRPLLLTVRGETETFSKPSHVIVRAANQVLSETDVGDSFSVSVPIPPGLLENGETTLTIETNQTYVPAERRSRSQDRRRLGLKIYECRVSPSS